jgi:hypothetical protein
MVSLQPDNDTHHVKLMVIYQNFDYRLRYTLLVTSQYQIIPLSSESGINKITWWSRPLFHMVCMSQPWFHFNI